MPKIIVGLGVAMLGTVLLSTGAMAADVEPVNCLTYGAQSTQRCPSGSTGVSYTIRGCASCSSTYTLGTTYITIPCKDSSGKALSTTVQGCQLNGGMLDPDIGDIPVIGAIECNDDDDCIIPILFDPVGYDMTLSAVCREPGTSDSYCEVLVDAECVANHYGTPKCTYNETDMSASCSGCTLCPTGKLASDVINIDQGSNSVYDCYLVQSDASRTDSTGTFMYDDDCHYSDSCMDYNNESGNVIGVCSTTAGELYQVDSNIKNNSSALDTYCWCNISSKRKSVMAAESCPRQNLCTKMCQSLIASNEIVRNAIGCN